jgi:hypothetical protein
MSDNFKKFLIALSAACFLSLLIFIVYKQIEIADKQKEIESSMIKQKDIGDSITRSMSQYATSKDLEMLIRGNGMDLSKISDDLTKLKSKIDSINVISSSSTGYDWHDIPSSGSINLPAPHGDPVSSAPVVDCGDKKITCLQDPNHYWTTTQLLDVHEEFKDIKVPFARVGFTASKDKPWGVSTYDRQYKVVTVTGTDEDGRVSNYNKMQIVVDNKAYDVPIDQAETTQQYPEAKFSWWNPRLYLTTGGSVGLSNPPISGSFNAGATLGISSYGQLKSSPLLSVFQVGVGYSSNQSKPAVIFNPVNVNIGKLLPNNLIMSTFIGPSLQLDYEKNVFLGANISVGL